MKAQYYSSNSQFQPKQFTSTQIVIKSKDYFFPPQYQFYSIQLDSVIYNNVGQSFFLDQKLTQFNQQSQQKQSKNQQVNYLNTQIHQQLNPNLQQQIDFVKLNFSPNKQQKSANINNKIKKNQHKSNAWMETVKNKQGISNQIQNVQTNQLIRGNSQNSVSKTKLQNILKNKIKELSSNRNRKLQKIELGNKILSPNKINRINRSLLKKGLSPKDDLSIMSDISKLNQLTQLQLLWKNEVKLKKINELNIKYQQSLKNNNYLYCLILNTELNLKKQYIAAHKSKIKNLIDLQNRTSLEYREKIMREINQLRIKCQNMTKQVKELVASIKKYDDNSILKQSINHKLNQIPTLKQGIVTIMIQIQKNKNTLKQLTSKYQKSAIRFEQAIQNIKSITELEYIHTDDSNDQLFQKYLNIKIECILKQQQKQKMKQKFKQQVSNKISENQLLKRQIENQSITIAKIDRINQILKQKINEISTKTFDQSFAINSENQDNNRAKSYHQSSSLKNHKYYTQDIYNKKRFYSPQKLKKSNTSSLYTQKKMFHHQIDIAATIDPNKFEKNSKLQNINNDLQNLLIQQMNSDQQVDTSINWKKIVRHKQKKGTQKIKNRLMRGLNFKTRMQSQKESAYQKFPQLTNRIISEDNYMDNFRNKTKNQKRQKKLQILRKSQQKTVLKKPQSINLLEIQESKQEQQKFK